MIRIPLKDDLRDRVLPILWRQGPYADTAAIRRGLKTASGKVHSATLNRYLHELAKKRVVCGAGRGWYSNLKTPFTLDPKPVRELVETLEKRFPLLDFSCWSTAQVARYAHHQLARFVSFVHCERDAMAAVADALRDAGWQAHLNPTRKEAAKSFRVEERTVIIRPAISRAPVEGKYATIEKILVDLYVEAQSLPILDLGEFHRLVANLAGQERISVGTLVHYAARRKVDASDVMKGIIN